MFWDLVYDGFPLASRMRRGLQREVGPCPCGTGPQTRFHVFWECPAAVSLRRYIESQLPHPTVLTPPDLWLLRPPRGVKPLVWRVVGLAALRGMDSARKLLFKLSKDLPREEALVGFWTYKAEVCARRTFAFELLSFASLGLVSSKWLSHLSPHHPFLSRDPATDKLRASVPPVI